ncbi:hypothetical protein HGRIS_008776 [Hohenbuehelia grisea]|uniref:U3 small nucleolar RNA-associated protein 14 n=1 Tax=Hohenbuehelia grisea TaxID=104357 RepID=A0ABR3J914_9AGAR
MANKARAPKSMMAKPRPSASKANAKGYARRHSRKAQSLNVARDTDVYEYQPEKSRRGKVALDLDRDELQGFGGLDEDDDQGNTALRARLIGEDMENEQIASDDDEEIDSDDAFEESDDERFVGFNFTSEKTRASKKAAQKGKTSASKVRFAEVDLNEDDDMAGSDGDSVHGDQDVDGDEEEEDGDPSEFIDVLDILDGKGDPFDEDEVAGLSSGASTSRPAEADSEEEDPASENDDADSAEEDAQGGASISASDLESDDDVNGEALDELQDFITQLNPLTASTKRKALDESEASAKPVKRRHVIKERTEAGAESEFGAFNSSGPKLSIDDLLAPLSQPSSSSASALLALQKSAKVLRPPENPKDAKSKKARTLSAPLPHRAQERLDREAAYEQTKEEIHKWNETMKRIRDADHLSFPLQPPEKLKTSNLELAARFKPTTPLESSISSLLQKAQLREQDIHQTEENALAAQKLSVEEVAARRTELRRMRELAFRAEVRARRVKKIKSKVYRRIRRKEKERAGAAGGDAEDDEDDEAAQLKAETERARERATLRHKHTGKWARAMRGKEGMDEDARGAIEDMLSRGERLRRKIQGRGSGSEDESDSEDDEGQDGDAEARVKARAFEELAQLDAEDAAVGETVGKKGKSVFEMKFMKDAMARARVDVDREQDDFIREIGGDVEDAGSSAGNAPADATGNADASQAAVERVGGRMVFRPGAVPPRISLGISTSLASDTSSVTLKSTDFPSPVESRPSQTPIQRSGLSSATRPEADEPENPWLAPRDASTKAPRKKNEVVVSKESAAAEKSKNRLKKQAKKLADEKEKAREDAEVDISMENVLGTATSANSQSKSTVNKSKSRNAVASTSEQPSTVDSDVDSEVEEQEKLLMLKPAKAKGKGPSAFEQRDLVALAFAGDNVVSQFEEIKRQEMAADAPQEVDTTLPGWGSWGGAGVRKQAPKPHLIKKVAGVDPKSRADFGKAHVIISEKRDKKAAKYLVKDLPYPYTSRAQFERSMDAPIGTEWNTRLAFQKTTLPKVVKKMGTVIDPLEKLF